MFVIYNAVEKKKRKNPNFINFDPHEQQTLEHFTNFELHLLFKFGMSLSLLTCSIWINLLKNLCKDTLHLRNYFNLQLKDQQRPSMITNCTINHQFKLMTLPKNWNEKDWDVYSKMQQVRWKQMTVQQPQLHSINIFCYFFSCFSQNISFTVTAKGLELTTT